MIFADVESKSRLKLVNREVNLATPSNPKFLKWSQTAIIFDQSDHPAHVPTQGGRLWSSTQWWKEFDYAKSSWTAAAA